MLKSSMKALLLAMAVTMFATDALAQNVRIAQIAVNGSGCRRGSVDAVLIGNQATILFSGYNVSTSPNSPVMTRGCAVAVALEGDPGVQIQVADINWRGAVAIEPGSQVTFTRSLGFAGQTGATVRDTFKRSTDFSLVDTAVGIVVNTCTQRTAIARANTSLQAQGAAAAASVDTADINATSVLLENLSFRLRLTTSQCR